MVVGDIVVHKATGVTGKIIDIKSGLFETWVTIALEDGSFKDYCAKNLVVKSDR